MTPLPCDEVLGLLNGRLSGGLASEDADRLEAHLTSCEACRHRAEQFLWDDRAFSELAAEGFLPKWAEKIRAAVRESARATRRKKQEKATPGYLRPFFGAVAAAAVVALAILIVLSSTPSPRPGGSPEAPKTADSRLKQVDEQVRRAEERMREIRQKEQELAAPAGTPAGDTAAEQKRREAQEALKAERERIEREMREAIEKARKPNPEVAKPPPAPEPGAPQEPEKPATPQTTPRSVTRAAAATVREAEGEVFAVTATERSRVVPGQFILEGQGLETAGGGSWAVVEYADRTRLEIKATDPVRLDFGIAGPSRRGKTVSLVRGTVAATVAKQPADEPMVFLTAHGEATVLGTSLRLAVDGTSTLLEVTEGKVRLKRLSDARAVEVPSGHFAVATAGGELKALPLFLFSDDFEKGSLAAWRVPADHPWRFRRLPDGKGRVLGGGTWQAKKPGDNYRVALQCGDAAWTDYVLEASVQLGSGPSTGEYGVLLLARMQAPGNLYAWEYKLDTGYVSILKVTAGAGKTIASGRASPSAPDRWHRLRFEVRGKRLTGLVDGKRMLEVEDEEFKSGWAGLTLLDPLSAERAILWDDVVVRPLPAGAK